MSRIIVKQLPKNINEEKLRNLFGSKGTITDMQLKYTPDGKFRQFCFIGYRSEDEAQAAIEFFNNSCIQTNRIKVEVCSALGGEDKPQSWSKHAKDSFKKIAEIAENADSKETNTKKKREKISKFEEIIGSHKDDPDFQEFMKAHDRNRTLWANDAGMVEKDENKEEETHKDKQIENAGKDEDDENNDSGEKENEDDHNDGDDDDEESKATEKLAEKPISDLEYMKSLMNKASTATDSKECNKTAKPVATLDLFTIKIHNVPYKAKRQEILKFFKPLKPYSVRLPTNVHGFCYVGFKTEKDMTKAMLKNKSFIKGKQVFFSDFTEKNKITKSKHQETSGEGKPGEHGATHNPKWAKQVEGIRNEENISESGCIFFRNLAYTVTDEDLQQVFEKYGPIAEIHLPVDTVTRQIKGFGTVTFVMPEHAVNAFNTLDGTDFHGRLLHLIPGKNKDGEEEADENDANLSFKQKKALKLKKTAQQSNSWNTLFLGANAVAEILAKKFQTSKEKILDTNDGGSSAAVRIALGETQIVIEMKKFLEENGVHLNAFDAPSAKRSKTIILAKNLPAETAVSDLTPLFAKFGPIGRLVLPPSGVTALIEFCDSTEAKQAFKKLAYSKFKNVPLYLEWAPENIFKTTLSGEPIIPKQEDKVEASAAVKDDADDKVDEANETENINANDDEENDTANEPAESNTTLFLRNLNFKTVQETVYRHFKHLGSIHTVEIAKRKDANDPRQMVSLGYGFIQFKKAAIAEKALKQMQFTNIDGNQVELKRSDRTLKTTNTVQRKTVALTKQTGTKILVRNIPFQAKVKEVRDIFKAFGEIRSLRLPMKMTPGEDTHRGFGFVDFITKSDAKKAFEALSQSTHLYGRRLVLEWASTTDEDVGELRKRTAEGFHISDKISIKRSKKAIFDTDEHILGSGTNADVEENDD